MHSEYHSIVFTWQVIGRGSIRVSVGLVVS
jgi:hypothetical protein